MTDPFRAEITAGYIVRERQDWAAAERLARSVRPRTARVSMLASLAGFFARDVTPRPEVQMLPRRERPAA